MPIFNLGNNAIEESLEDYSAIKVPEPAMVMQREGVDPQKGRRFSLERAREKAQSGIRIAQENAKCQIL